MGRPAAAPLPAPPPDDAALEHTVPPASRPPATHDDLASSLEQAYTAVVSLLLDRIERLEEAVSDLRQLVPALAEVRRDLESTVGFRLGETFACPSCEARGAVALPVRCTACGHETQHGWWPQQS